MGKPKYPHIHLAMNDDMDRLKEIVSITRDLMRDNGVTEDEIEKFSSEARSSSDPIKICRQWISCDWDCA